MTTEKKTYTEQEEKEIKATHKGTLFSVGVVGAVILVTYFLIYGLYMTRV